MSKHYKPKLRYVRLAWDVTIHANDPLIFRNVLVFPAARVGKIVLVDYQLIVSIDPDAMVELCLKVVIGHFESYSTDAKLA